jgi:two-component system cell cycle response regulator
MAILVVEDNEDNLALLDYLLRAYGHLPLLARNGADGVRIAIEERPELILLDIRMPGMDGHEVAATIKSTPGLEQTCIVAVTASVLAGERERIVASGFDGYIAKPIDPESFIGELEPFLPGPPAAETSAGER